MYTNIKKIKIIFFLTAALISSFFLHAADMNVTHADQIAKAVVETLKNMPHAATDSVKSADLGAFSALYINHPFFCLAGTIVIGILGSEKFKTGIQSIMAYEIFRQWKKGFKELWLSIFQKDKISKSCDVAVQGEKLKNLQEKIKNAEEEQRKAKNDAVEQARLRSTTESKIHEAARLERELQETKSTFLNVQAQHKVEIERLTQALEQEKQEKNKKDFEKLSSINELHQEKSKIELELTKQIGEFKRELFLEQERNKTLKVTLEKLPFLEKELKEKGEKINLLEIEKTKIECEATKAKQKAADLVEKNKDIKVKYNNLRANFKQTVPYAPIQLTLPEKPHENEQEKPLLEQVVMGGMSYNNYPNGSSKDSFNPFLNPKKTNPDIESLNSSNSDTYSVPNTKATNQSSNKNNASYNLVDNDLFKQIPTYQSAPRQPRAKNSSLL